VPTLLYALAQSRFPGQFFCVLIKAELYAPLVRCLRVVGDCGTALLVTIEDRSSQRAKAKPKHLEKSYESYIYRTIISFH